MGHGGSRDAPARAGLPATLLAVLLALLMLPTLTGCSQEVTEARTLQTTLRMIDGVSDSDVASATTDSVARVDVMLDLDLDPGATLAVIRDVTEATDETGWTDYLLQVRRSPVDEDRLVVDDAFAGSRGARVVTENWIRVSDALLGEVDYSYQAGNETIAVASGGGIGHDVLEASRIGYGWGETTWRFSAEGATFVVSGRVERRDATLFDRVQRSVSSSVLPVPALAWRLERRTTHVLLDLEVMIAGEDPERISVERWGESLRPLAQAALNTTRYPGRSRWLLISDRTDTDERDTFASWSSTSRPVKGRDPHLRGWDQWWWTLAKKG